MCGEGPVHRPGSEPCGRQWSRVAATCHETQGPAKGSSKSRDTRVALEPGARWREPQDWPPVRFVALSSTRPRRVSRIAFGPGNVRHCYERTFSTIIWDDRSGSADKKF